MALTWCDMTIRLIQGDCLEKMQDIPDGSIDMVLTDPPYGTTACKWDSVIPFEPMWEQLKRITKKRGAIVLTGSQPFTSALIMSNVKMFKYCWVWDKKIPSGMGFAKYQPMRQTEDLAVFCDGATIYNPEMILRDKPIKSGGQTKGAFPQIVNRSTTFKKTYTHKNPVNLIRFDRVRRDTIHPTQKPVALMEYLIKTYTNPGETVLDFTMGSGSTGVACVNLDRSFIGIELDAEYFKIASDRIHNTSKRLI